MNTNNSPAKLRQLHKALENIIATPQITPATFEDLDEFEQAELCKLIKQKMEAANNEFTRLSQIMGEVAQLPANRLTWENNHQKITKAIYAAMCKTGQMPTQAYISETTGLSRQTVAKHLAEGEDASVFAEQMQNFSAMAPQVLTRVVKAAMHSDLSVPAMKLYFQMLEKLQDKGQVPMLSQQNNYIQVNNTIIKQQTLQQLSPEQLQQIEEIVQRNLPLASGGDTE
jgi:predicted transcriptional regulator